MEAHSLSIRLLTQQRETQLPILVMVEDGDGSQASLRDVMRQARDNHSAHSWHRRMLLPPDSRVRPLGVLCPRNT